MHDVEAFLTGFGGTKQHARTRTCICLILVYCRWTFKGKVDLDRYEVKEKFNFSIFNVLNYSIFFEGDRLNSTCHS